MSRSNSLQTKKITCNPLSIYFTKLHLFSSSRDLNIFIYILYIYIENIYVSKTCVISLSSPQLDLSLYHPSPSGLVARIPWICGASANWPCTGLVVELVSRSIVGRFVRSSRGFHRHECSGPAQLAATLT